MTAVAQPRFATPLIASPRRWLMDKLRDAAASQWLLPLCTALMLGITVAQIVFGAGGLLGGGAVNAGHLQKQLDDLTAQVSRLSDRLEAGPRADQLHDMDRHLSNIDGRMEAMDSRLRADEERLTRVTTKIESIDDASRANLTGRPK